MPHAILASIVDITNQRDVRSVEASMAAAMMEHVAAESVRLIGNVPGQEGSYRELVAVRRNSGDAEEPFEWSGDRTLDQLPAPAERCFRQNTVAGDELDASHCLCLPVLRDDQVFAVVELRSSQSLEAELPLLRALVKIYSNYLYILHESECDKLTGLYNRRTFDSKFQVLVSDQKSQQQQDSAASEQRRHSDADSAWLGIIDIDHFKRINDTYGHIYGDEILLLMAQKMQSFYRRFDLLFRFGGEEFVILLEPCDEDSAKAVFNRFRREVAEFGFPQVGQVTVSIGVARIDENSLPTVVFGNADQALYHAKNAGRNRVYTYPELVRSGYLTDAGTEGDIDLF